MKVEFRTIEIEQLVLIYVGTMITCLVLYLLTNFKVHFGFFLFLPIVLYLSFRGKMTVEISEKVLITQWIKKPILTSIRNNNIKLTEIIRWKYEYGGRGPDQIIIIQESGERINIRPSVFSTVDLRTKIWKELDKKMADHYSGTPKKIHKEKILKSGYINDLNRKINRCKIALLIILIMDLTFLSLGAILRSEAEIIWVFFLIFFCSAIFMNFRYGFLKMERKNTLDWG